MVRDKGCAFPGCRHTRFLHAHHVKHWLHGGETSTENLVMLCSFHHRLVHEGGWDVSHGPCEGDGSDTPGGGHACSGFLFHSPFGRTLEQNPHLERVDDPNRWMREWADEHGVDLSPEANYPKWDGSSANYSYILEGLFWDRPDVTEDP